jgi:glycosyltransferase involved in cell wall biosynthesis
VFVADNDPDEHGAQNVCSEQRLNFRWPLTCEVIGERGISAARNAILDFARAQTADFLAMLDDDEVAEERWLRELLDAQGQSGADVVGGPVRAEFSKHVDGRLASSALFGLRDLEHGVTLEGTGNVLLSCDSLRRIGWPRFDPAFGLTGGEDKEFFTRIRKRGINFGWALRAVAWEHVPPSRLRAGWVLRRAYRIGNNDLRVDLMHGSRTDVIASVGRAAVVLGAAPLCLPILFFGRARLNLLSKWARSAGKVTAILGRSHRDYATPPTEGVRS